MIIDVDLKMVSSTIMVIQTRLETAVLSVLPIWINRNLLFAKKIADYMNDLIDIGVA